MLAGALGYSLTQTARVLIISSSLCCRYIGLMFYSNTSPKDTTFITLYFNSFTHALMMFSLVNSFCFICQCARTSATQIYNGTVTELFAHSGASFLLILCCFILSRQFLQGSTCHQYSGLSSNHEKHDKYTSHLLSIVLINLGLILFIKQNCRVLFSLNGVLQQSMQMPLSALLKFILSDNQFGFYLFFNYCKVSS